LWRRSHDLRIRILSGMQPLGIDPCPCRYSLLDLVLYMGVEEIMGYLYLEGEELQAALSQARDQASTRCCCGSKNYLENKSEFYPNPEPKKFIGIGKIYPREKEEQMKKPKKHITDKEMTKRFEEMSASEITVLIRTLKEIRRSKNIASCKGLRDAEAKRT